MATPQGLVLYRGPSLIGHGNVVAIVVGFRRPSRNSKTGPMLQCYILPDRDSPLAALQGNRNQAACGRCALQGRYDAARGRMVDRVCYVNVGHAPEGIWSALKRRQYPRYCAARHRHLFAGSDIRIGAYGDPAALPVPLVRWLSAVGRSWTGYSHQLFWIDQRRAAALSRYLMASCHTPAQHGEALRRGWRAFTVVPHGSAPPDGAVECPHYSHGVTCQDCGMCRGTSLAARSVWVRAHAKTGLNLHANPQ